MISIDIYILYNTVCTYIWFLLFCHCTSYWWNTHFLETTNCPQQNQREKKTVEKTSDLPLWLSFSMRWFEIEPDLQGTCQSSSHAGIKRGAVIFPSEGFSRFVCDVFSWRLIQTPLFKASKNWGGCFYFFKSWFRESGMRGEWRKYVLTGHWHVHPKFQNEHLET